MNQERWTTLSRNQQIAMIGSELMRAHVWQTKDQGKFSSALERSLGLVDATLADKKWLQDSRMLLGLRDHISQFYIHQRTDDIITLYHAL